LTRAAIILTIEVRKLILTGGAAMLTAKLTSKGQVTIPKEVRDKLGLSRGEELQFYEDKGVFYLKKGLKKSPFDKWLGHLKKHRGGKTDALIEELRGR
jgi:AbrB family looped-hinge helix DNA binding protein